MAQKTTYKDFLFSQNVQSVLELMQMNQELEELQEVRWTGWEAEMLELEGMGVEDENFKRND